MRRDLRQPCPPPLWPCTTQLIEFNLELAPSVHQLLRLGCGEVSDVDTWACAFTRDAEFDPRLCFVVADDQGLIGVAQCWTSAFVRDLVIHPRARRQGLARALLHHAFAVLRQRGEACLDLKVLETNAPARRLYETSGMGYVQRFATD
ncbi:MAG: GNAT family N-acetyltransferase [Pseudomonas sp.]